MFVTVLALIHLAPQGYLLFPRYKGGEKVTYGVSTFFSLGPNAVTVDATAVETVLDAGNDGISVERVLKDVKLNQGGKVQSLGDVSSQRIMLAPNGQLLQILSSKKKPDEVRQGSMSQFIAPMKEVEPGQGWMATLKKDDSVGVRKMELTYRFQGVEQVAGQEVGKVDVTAKELEGASPMTSAGTVWISTKNGRTLKSVFTIKNAAMLGGPGAEVTMRQEVK